MKRIFSILIVVLAAAALFGWLVHAVLAAAHVTEPATTTIHGLTPRRLWATIVVLLAFGGVITGGLALRKSTRQIDPHRGRNGAIVALSAGFIAAINGGLNVAIANGGPGTGNGVVGGAAALVLGIFAMVIGVFILVRVRRIG